MVCLEHWDYRTRAYTMHGLTERFALTWQAKCFCPGSLAGQLLFWEVGALFTEEVGLWQLELSSGRWRRWSGRRGQGLRRCGSRLTTRWRRRWAPHWGGSRFYCRWRAGDVADHCGNGGVPQRLDVAGRQGLRAAVQVFWVVRGPLDGALRGDAGGAVH
jgi:hypothetical protein